MAGLDPATQGNKLWRLSDATKLNKIATFQGIGGEPVRVTLGGRVKPGHDEF